MIAFISSSFRSIFRLCFVFCFSATANKNKDFFAQKIFLPKITFSMPSLVWVVVCVFVVLPLTDIHAQTKDSPPEESQQRDAFEEFSDSAQGIARIRKLMEENLSLTKTRKLMFKEYRNGKLTGGEIRLKVPMLMRITYLENRKRSVDILVDEGGLYIHLVKQRLVYEQEWGVENNESLEMFNPKFLLENYSFRFFGSAKHSLVFGVEDLKKFNLPQRYSQSLAYRLKLSPRDVRKGLDELVLWVNSEGDVVRMSSRDTQRKTVDFVFYEISKNDFIPDVEFEFVMPSNVRIIKNLVPVKKTEDVQ